MPKIEEFNAGNLALRPSEVGVDATAAAARRIGAAYHQAAGAKEQTGHLIGSGVAAAGEAAVAIEDHREISTGAAQGVKTLYNLEQSKDAAIAEIDPNDPAFGPKVEARLKQWRDEEVEPALASFKQGFNTQKSQDWAESFIDKTRTSLFHSSTSDVANAQAVGFRNATKATINTATNLVTQKPELLDDQLDLLRHSLTGSGSALKGVAGVELMNSTIEKASEGMVKSAALAAILKSDDPEKTAADFAKRYPQYISGAEELQLGRAAKGQMKANANADYTAQEHARTLRVQQGTADLGKVYTDNVTWGDDGRPVIKPEIFKQARQIALGNPDVADHARTLQDWAEKKLADKKETWNSNPNVKQQLYDGLFNADRPVTDIDLKKANINHSLSDHDYRQLEDMRKMLEERPLRGPVWQGTMEGVKGALGTDPVGHEKYAQFVQKFIPAYLTLPPDQQAKALNISDPTSLLSQTMAPLKRDMMTILTDKITRGATLPGDSENPMFGAAALKAISVKPTTVRQNGREYHLQSDGSYK